MIELLVVSLTATPVAVGAIHGFRVGGRRLIGRWGPLVLSYAVGVVTATFGFHLGWFAPLGLVTPLLTGILAATATGVLLHRVARVRGELASSPPGTATRTAGAIAGLVGGLVIASSSWLGLAVIDGWRSVTPTYAAPTRGDLGDEWLYSLVRTANRGFLRHLPVIGPASDEIESLIFVLNSDPAICERLADEKGWKALRGLPSFQAIIEDFEILDEIDSVSRGNLAALYRLQRNSKVIKFVMDDKVRAVLSGVHPSALAREIEQIESRRRTRERVLLEPATESSPRRIAGTETSD